MVKLYAGSIVFQEDNGFWNTMYSCSARSKEEAVGIILELVKKDRSKGFNFNVIVIEIQKEFCQEVYGKLEKPLGNTRPYDEQYHG